MPKGLHIFRRDLRLSDNAALEKLADLAADHVYGVFILDPRQAKKNGRNSGHYSAAAVRYMLACVAQVPGAALMKGKTEDVVARLVRELGVSHVSWNSDSASDFAASRDAAVREACEKAGATCVVCEGDGLMRRVSRSDGSPYMIFSAYRKSAKEVPRPSGRTVKLSPMRGDRLPSKAPSDEALGYVPVGRAAALRAIESIGPSSAASSAAPRLADGTKVSAALNFGCLSAREAYWATRDPKFRDGLAWRDFFAEIHFRHPAGRDFDRHIEPAFDGFPWTRGAAAEAAWKRLDDCRTGFLVIDAAMTQMKRVGHCPNYARMLLSFFWTKLLRIDPCDAKYGAQTGFSRYLVDAVGPSQNRMNHEWMLSFDYAGRRYAPKGAGLAGRPFDVARSVAKLDPKGDYVRKWLPCLKDAPTQVLRHWSTEGAVAWGHVGPMFDAGERWEEWVALCREAGRVRRA
jgi:deoxyribodipyrimidine photo-lyase